MKKNSKIIIFSVLFLLFLWEVVAIMAANDMIVPKISSVLTSFVQILSTSEIYIIIAFSIVKIILLLIVSFIIAMVLSILSYKSDKFMYMIKPFMLIVKSMPIITIIILVLMVFNMKFSSSIATMFVIIPIVYEGVFGGLKRIDCDIIDDIKTYADEKKVSIIFKIQLPLIRDVIISCFAQTAGLGFKVMLMSEYVSPSNNSMGAVMRRYYNNNDMPKVYCIVIISIILVVFIDLVFKKIIKNKNTK